MYFRKPDRPGAGADRITSVFSEGFCQTAFFPGFCQTASSFAGCCGLALAFPGCTCWGTGCRLATGFCRRPGKLKKTPYANLKIRQPQPVAQKN